MIRRAALVVPLRERDGERECFLVARSPELKFFGGYDSFPGGCVEDGDGEFEAPARSGVDPSVDESDGSDSELSAVLGCAVRELFEETGVLLAEGELSPRERDEMRSRLSSGEADASAFARFLAERRLRAESDRLHLLTRLLTPAFVHVRYDATFFLLEMTDSDAEPVIHPGELVGGSWIRPADALAEWRRGERRIAPTALAVLEAFAQSSVDDARRVLGEIPREYSGSGFGIQFAPGYALLPLHAPPLPPSIPTNAFLLGWERKILVDPGYKNEREVRHLIDATRRALDGRSLDAIVLTHHHIDHVAALDAVVEEFRAPVWAHSITGELLERSLDRELAEGDEIELGASADGRPDWRLEVCFTPGHARGHITLYDSRFRRLLAGDLVSTLVSMYVGAPGGDLHDYFESLERMLELDIATLFPSHGAPTDDAERTLRGALERRRARVEETAAFLTSSPQSVQDLALLVYPKIDREMRPLIERTTRAVLLYLAREGRAIESAEDRFTAATRTSH